MHDIAKCTECGLCRSSCPVFGILKKETLSPRGKIRLLKENIQDELIFACTLCKNCTVACPLGLDIAKYFLKYREKLAKGNKTTIANKRIIENIKNCGNPFGKKIED